MVGCIYLAKIYFTDLSAYKIRPVLLIKEMGNDFICLQISSQLNNNRIRIAQTDLKQGQNTIYKLNLEFQNFFLLIKKIKMLIENHLLKLK